MGILMIGKRINGSQSIISSRMLSTEQLDRLKKNGWVLSQIDKQHDNFEYNFVKENPYRTRIVGL
jgi:hypothetical protein